MIKYSYILRTKDGGVYLTPPSTSTVQLLKDAYKLINEHGKGSETEYKQYAMEVVTELRDAIKFVAGVRKAAGKPSSGYTNKLGGKTKTGSSWEYKKEWLARKKEKEAAGLTPAAKKKAATKQEKQEAFAAKLAEKKKASTEARKNKVK